MSTHKEKLDWCLANEKRMKRITPDESLSREHLLKAKHKIHPIFSFTMSLMFPKSLSVIFGIFDHLYRAFTNTFIGT